MTQNIGDQPWPKPLQLKGELIRIILFLYTFSWWIPRLMNLEQDPLILSQLYISFQRLPQIWSPTNSFANLTCPTNPSAILTYLENSFASLSCPKNSTAKSLYSPRDEIMVNFLFFLLHFRWFSPRELNLSNYTILVP